MSIVLAAHVLDLSTRQVRRLLQRMRTDGAASIRHNAIGRLRYGRRQRFPASIHGAL
ncbi:helix-turn-helix domain-containing protein [Shinella zoogloeoides]|uniref:helix-turn-helix domain-containing protein n=1 Tax=Shinella zoogloeoides TaxID=352475 RepID=UPI00273E1716|nr:helix-turn-helix domain-containing protein [Shinella zoogloeoides]WLR91655.1 hypothetical protein Q9316_14310 [Shinella zoogloeoides]